MAIHDDDLLLVNDSQDSNKAKKITYSTLKSNINGDDTTNNLQAVTNNGSETTNGAEFGGLVAVNRPSDSNACYQATDGNPAQPKFRVTAGGRLTIGTNVANGPDINIQLDPNGRGYFAGGDIQLMADGSASFAGNVSTNRCEAGPNPSGSGTDASGSRITETGILQARKSSTETGDFINCSKYNADETQRFKFRVQNDGTTFINASGSGDSPTSSIKLAANGSAQFAAGNHVVNADGSSFFKQNIWISEDGTLSATVDWSRIAKGLVEASRVTETQAVWNGKHANVTTSTIQANGALWCKGNISSDGTIGFNLEPDDPANYTVTSEQYEETEEATPFIPAVEATYDENGYELTPFIPAVQATYQTVTKTREVRTYNGPTLNIKDRILNLVARIDALEANEIIDDAVDSSLLQLLASQSARLDSIEARLTALEGGN